MLVSLFIMLEVYIDTGTEVTLSSAFVGNSHCSVIFKLINRMFVSDFHRFVSDVGFEGHKQLCQHKALQCANIEPYMSRVYPPCLLEWRAIQHKANMALDVRFPDGRYKVNQ